MRMRGFIISARPTASICCSPPESVPAICQERSLQSWEKGVYIFDVVLQIIAAQISADFQVFKHRKVGKHAPPLWNHAHAHGNDLFGD